MSVCVTVCVCEHPPQQQTLTPLTPLEREEPRSSENSPAGAREGHPQQPLTGWPPAPWVRAGNRPRARGPRAAAGVARLHGAGCRLWTEPWAHQSITWVPPAAVLYATPQRAGPAARKRTRRPHAAPPPGRNPFESKSALDGNFNTNSSPCVCARASPERGNPGASARAPGLAPHGPCAVPRGQDAPAGQRAVCGRARPRAHCQLHAGFTISCAACTSALSRASEGKIRGSISKAGNPKGSWR